MAAFDDFEIPVSNQGDTVAGAKQLVAKIRQHWKPEQLREKIFSDGITNVLVGIFQQDCKDDMVLVRIYGHGTDQIIDRKAEIENIKLFAEKKCGPGLLASFKNGIAYPFVKGQITNSEMIVQAKVFEPVIDMFAQMHLMRLGGDPCLWIRMRRLNEVAPDNFDHKPELKRKFEELGIMTKSELYEQIGEMEKLLGKSNSPVVFCHNDLLLGNIVYDEGRVTFIDYEYGCQNYQAYDIANHFCEFVGISDEVLNYEKWYPNEDFQKNWISRYLKAFNQGKLRRNKRFTKLTSWSTSFPSVPISFGESGRSFKQTIRALTLILWIIRIND
jgi:ethanolamine kinase